MGWRLTVTVPYTRQVTVPQLPACQVQSHLGSSTMLYGMSSSGFQGFFIARQAKGVSCETQSAGCSGSAICPCRRQQGHLEHRC